MRHAKRTDANHADIRDGLRQLGYDVLDLSDVGGGVPDLCVRNPDGWMPAFLEVKDGAKSPSRRELTESEIVWMRYCGYCTRIVLTLDEAVTAIRDVFALTRGYP